MIAAMGEEHVYLVLRCIQSSSPDAFYGDVIFAVHRSLQEIEKKFLQDNVLCRWPIFKRDRLARKHGHLNKIGFAFVDVTQWKADGSGGRCRSGRHILLLVV
jgi:hypothetical protein